MSTGISFLLFVALSIVTSADAVSPVKLFIQKPTRMMASRAVTTVVSYRTTVPTCRFTTSCAITNGAVTACRRLRRRDIDIDSIFPSQPIRVEATPAPIAEVGSFMPDIFSSSSDPKDVLVNGLLPGGHCGSAAGPFGVTIIYTRTVVSEATCLSSITHTNTFTLAGCTPSGLIYCSPDSTDN